MGKFRSQRKKAAQRRLENQQNQEQDNQKVEPQIKKKMKTVPQYFLDIQNNPQAYFVNPMFKQYYKTVLASEFKDEQEFDQFWTIMKEKLPVTFRINPNIVGIETYQNNLLKGQNYLKLFAQEAVELQQQKEQEQQKEKQIEEEKQQEEQQQQKNDENQNKDATQLRDNYRVTFPVDHKYDIEDVKLVPKDWYPNKQAFQLDISKYQLRKEGVLKQFHVEMTRASESGLITRQEFVSMLPPLLLQVQPTDRVFDMCAAPGSKTSQILEIMMSQAQKPSDVTGCVIANDVDTNRAYMLSHQIDRSSTSAMMVVNHQAQFFPSLKDPQTKQRIQFDKVLCDVPCTGDGAARKIPKKFQDWCTRDAIVLYSVQLSILIRAIQLCKVGGTVVYSTCSINPLEDEAVVIEALKRAEPGSIELLDCHKRLPLFKGRPGMTNWPVICSKFKKSKCYDKTTEQMEAMQFDEMFRTVKKEDVGKFPQEITKDDNQYAHIVEGMFPESEEVMNKFGIQRTMRVLPHDQNTGGFYLAVFRKKANKVFVQGSQFDASKIVPPSENEDNFEINQQDEQGNLDQEAIQESEFGIIKEIDAKETFENHLKKTKLDSKFKQQQKQQEQLAQEQANENQGQEVQQQQQQEDQQQQEKQQPETEKSKKNDINLDSKYEFYEEIDDKAYETLVNDYGLQGLEKSLLLTNKKGGQKLIKLVTPSIRDIIRADTNESINYINCGTRAFKRDSRQYSTDQCLYRICDDAVLELLPYINKRKYKITKEDFLSILGKQNIKFDEIPNKQFVEQIKQMGTGSCILYFDSFNGKIDAFAAQVFSNSIQYMISKENIEGYKLIYQNKKQL